MSAIPDVACSLPLIIFERIGATKRNGMKYLKIDIKLPVVLTTAFNLITYETGNNEVFSSKT